MALPDLSRDCIRDTLMYKRDRTQWNQPCNLTRSLYNLSIQRLRAGQLSRHIETQMRCNRYLDMQTLKKVAPEIVIVVRGGHIKQIRSTNPFTSIFIADYDAACDDPEAFSRMEEAEERGSEPDLHTIYEN